MKKIHQLSYRTQIFIASLSLVIFPAILLGLFAVNDSTTKLIKQYNDSLSTIATQTNLMMDTLLQDALKVADMPILSEDVRKAMITDYEDNYLLYAQDSSIFRDSFNQTNRLNTNLETCIFINRYDFSFEYNITSALHKKQIDQNMTQWIETARASSNYTYFVPLQTHTYGGTSKQILPMVKILHDKYDYKEIGICYFEINFKPIEDIILTAQNTGTTLFIYDADNQQVFSSNSAYIQEPEKYSSLLSELSDFNESLENTSGITETELTIDHSKYRVFGCINKTTNWHLVQFVDNKMLSQIYKDNLFNYIRILILCLFLGILLAIRLSGTLTRSILGLCHEIDSLDAQSDVQIDESAYGSNPELKKLIVSFNHLSQRLTTSLKQNYQIQLAEQKMKIQMLQFQINHHFLYNTLNVIRSLANIHNILQIETIALCMSDLLRYNLERFPVALLEEELAQVNHYMTIQNIRFAGRYTCDINIPPSFLQMEIPVFLLQPLVENSIEHGFSRRESDCYISISCHSEEDKLHLLVVDNGDGIPSAKLIQLNQEDPVDTLNDQSSHGRRSIGIQNVRQRIRSYFGNSYGLIIDSKEGEGTIVDIILPNTSAPGNP